MEENLEKMYALLYAPTVYTVQNKKPTRRKNEWRRFLVLYCIIFLYKSERRATRRKNEWSFFCTVQSYLCYTPCYALLRLATPLLRFSYGSPTVPTVLLRFSYASATPKLKVSVKKRTYLHISWAVFTNKISRTD